MGEKVHLDAKAHYGRPRTACGNIGDRTRFHQDVTCLQCRATKVYKKGPAVLDGGVVVSRKRLAALVAVLDAARPFANLVTTWGDHKRALQQAVDAADRASGEASHTPAGDG